MSDYLWPAQLTPNYSQIEIIDNSGRSAAPMSGFTRTVSRPGERLRMTLRIANANDSTTARKRAVLHGIIAALRGGVNRIWCHDHSYTKAGSFSASELAPSATFENGTTGLTTGTQFSSAVNDRILRATRISNDGTGAGIVRLTNAATVTPYQPYCGRAIVTPHRGLSTGLALRFGSSGFAADYGAVTGFSDGHLSAVFVPYASTAHFGIVQDQSGTLAGDILEIPFISFAPCALVDNGANLLRYSSDLTPASASPQVWITNNMSVTTTSVTLPDGSASSGIGHSLHEDTTAADQHYIYQNVTVASTANVDYCFAVALHSANRTWARIGMVEADGATVAGVYVDLSSGALSNTATGANWSDVRTFSQSMGDGWYYVAIVARKTNTATVIRPRIWIAEAANDITFTGIDQNSIRVWRPSFAASGVPMRLTSTTSTTYASGQDQNLAGGIYTKGWPASTSALLKQGDQVQIGQRLYILAGPVDSDAAGRAWLPIAQSMRVAPDDNDPVIINQPMARFMLEPNENGWSNTPMPLSDSEIVLAEAA